MTCMTTSTLGKFEIPILPNSCRITFQVASTREDAHRYQNAFRKSVNRNTENYKRIHIFENIDSHEKYDVFRATPENSKVKGYPPNGLGSSELIMNNKFKRALKNSISTEKEKRRQMIRNNFEITSLQRVQEERKNNSVLPVGNVKEIQAHSHGRNLA